MKTKIIIAMLWMALVSDEKVLEVISLPTHLLAPPTTSPTKIEKEMKRRLDNLKGRYQRIQGDLSLFGEDFFSSHPQGRDQVNRISSLMEQIEGKDGIEEEYGYGLGLSGFDPLTQLLRRLISNMEEELAIFKGQERTLNRDTQVELPDELIVDQQYDLKIRVVIPSSGVTTPEKSFPPLQMTITVSAPGFDIGDEVSNHPLEIVPNQNAETAIRLIPRELGTQEVQVIFEQNGRFLGLVGVLPDVRRAPIHFDNGLTVNL